MKRYLLFAAGIAIMFGIAISWQPLHAQIYGEFDTVRLITNAPYQELDAALDVPVPATNLGLPPNWIPDFDDGYAYPTGVDIGFPYEFNGLVYTKTWICVNGFITFTPPPFVPSKVATGLFIESVSYPRNVVAPFWGDHVYRLQNERLNGYKPSRISYQTDNGVFTVQWKDLNINDATVKSSVGNFQVKLYVGSDTTRSYQGDIEFCYGPVGGNPYTPETDVVTKNASIGLKGFGGDFLNGLTYNQDPSISRTSTVLTNQWPPSDGATDRRIRFNGLGRYNIEEWWGDGDVDFSKGRNAKHEGMPQNRFVTVNDARLIMRAVAKAIPLDSVRRRSAYHGDVNHNGRYWYDNNGVRQDIYWRDKSYGQNLPPGVSDWKRIFFQATEYDAAMILHYISGRLPELPWLLDTIPMYGKINADNNANNIRFGTPAKIDNGTFNVPVYLNGYHNGPLAAKFNVDGKVLSVDGTIYSQNELLTDNNENTVVFSGSGTYETNEAIAYINVQTDKSVLKATNIRFNDVKVSDVEATVLSANDDYSNSSVTVEATPNPFKTKMLVTLNIQNPGFYDFVIFDALGNKVKTLAIGQIDKADIYRFEWNGTNDAGNQIQSGVYFLKLTGNNVSISKKLLYTR